IAVSPVLLKPMLPRDAPAHAFGPGYAWEILTGRASPDLCHYWYMGFPYTTFYCFLPYYLAAPLAALIGPVHTFVVELLVAAILFTLGVYLLAKSVGFDRERAVAASVLAATGMLPEWEWGGIYPMTMSFGFGLLALATRDRRVLSPILLALSLYSHPLGGTLSSLVMLLWGLFERELGYIVSVGIAWLLAAPHYAFFLPYARWLSTLIDSPAPDELLRMLFMPFPDLISPGIFLLLLAGLGLWRVRSQPWARVAGVCWALAYGLVLAYSLGLARHLPLGRELLIDRFTCVLITPLLALPAAYALKDRSRRVRTVSKVLLVLSVSSAAIPLSDTLSYEMLSSKLYHRMSGTVDTVKWVAEHRPHDPLARVQFFPFLSLWGKEYMGAHNALWVGPRLTGFFAQGDPYFHALTERAEWEPFWWYDPEFTRTVCRLCNIHYLIVPMYFIAKAGTAGLVPVHRSGHIIVLENREVAGAEAVDPIGVYDPRPNFRELVKEYTTALNLVPERGYRYVFAMAEDPRELHAFRKVLVRPGSPGDVRLALRLAREGKHVLLVLPAGNDRIARKISRELCVRLRRSDLRLRPEYPRVKSILPRRLLECVVLKGPRRFERVPPGYQVDGKWWRDVRVGRGTVRVVGIDLPVAAIRLHPTILNVRRYQNSVPPLPSHRERALFSGVLRGFGSEPRPVPCRFDPRSTRTVIFPEGNEWVLVKLKHFPAWHARGGKILVGPGGTMIVRAHSPRVVLRFAFPTRLYVLGAVGFALGALALLWIGSKGKGGGWVRSMIGNLRESRRTTRRRQSSAGHR
ncbi:6-pyruvoyl-tetrahydropterin synthase-related protein, partial [Methanopyrus sp.]